jgi:hypothetical protein
MRNACGLQRTLETIQARCISAFSNVRCPVELSPQRTFRFRQTAAGYASKVMFQNVAKPSNMQ